MKRFSLTVFFILVIIALLMITGSLWMESNKRKEPFLDLGIGGPTSPVEIRMCPKTSSTIQTAIGNTDCCTGELMNGKCNGETLATLSPNHGSVPSILDFWKKHFVEKGKTLCPPSMPNYFEDVANTDGPKGCSASIVSTDGKQPRDTRMTKCTIYAHSDLNETRSNSCYLLKQRDSIVCPNLPGYGSTIAIESEMGGIFKYFACKYQTSDGLPSMCAENNSFSKFLTRTNPNWRTSSQSTQLNSTFCSQFINARKDAELLQKKLQQEQEARQAAERAQKAAEEKARRIKEELDAANKRFQDQIASWRRRFRF